ncbi:MAG: amino acid ABC transporter permease [Pseudomonadota bacterium]
MTDTSVPRQTAFVAEKMIEASPPPANSVGVIGWVRANLFPDVLNGALTLLCVAFLVWLLPELYHWAFAGAVWQAGSLSECREIMNATLGEGQRAACWAVVNERFNQFMFGYYPAELRWRPVLAFVLLIAALGPVLFTWLPYRRQGLLFTLAYPVIGYYLLWGGSIWPFATFLIGVGAGVAAFRYVFAQEHPVFGSVGVALLAGIAVAALYWNVLWGPISDGIEGALGPLGPESVASDRFGGLLLTVVLGVTSLSAALPLGILLALGRQSKLLFIRMISVVFIEFVRGVPLITLLFVATTLLGYFLPPGSNFDLILRVIIMSTFFAAAYIAEAIRGGLAALPKGQYEAADALGLTYWQATRKIVLPQALKISIPSIVNIFIGLFKDTTLVSIIGLADPLGIIQPILATPQWNGIVAEMYVFVALLFFCFCFAMSRYSMYLERRLKTDHR